MAKRWPEVLRQVVQWQSEAFRGVEETGRVNAVRKSVQKQVAVNVRVSEFDGGGGIAMTREGETKQR